MLDALRGFALLGILLVNVELMRGPGLYAALAGQPGPTPTGADGVVDVVVGWLATGKFVSSFSLMFGLGAALIAGRVLDRGGSPRGLLARRYGWLLGFGLAHMLLLFPGDILFAYGLTGLVLLAFVQLPVRVVAGWGAGILAVLGLGSLGFAALALAVPGAASAGATGSTGAMGGFAGFFADRADAALAARTGGGPGDVLTVNAWEALLVQGGQLFVLPWILGLFLLGFAAGRSGLVRDLAAYRGWLRRAAVVGILVGLPLNVPLGLVGTLGGTGGGGWAEALALPAQLLGAPVLAVGYLATLALLCLRFGVPRPLAAVGRTALTGYLLQSLLALVVFTGFSRYGQWGATASLGVVVGIWGVLLVLAPWWLRHFRFGPAEWLWRWLTYGRRPALRHDPAAATGRDQ
ncbi:hypothetical protein GCM10011354_04320 [Egicoccus halophilus]|uniref:DUF418 domain-containing protein n=1 Tax=Egicoccus halophilus TaxID=1670830 RepID=A0A8J3ET98_9ACTN|nr:hypothetical protein GCM10011354_04320 [Egicoccus halophilus]